MSQINEGMTLEEVAAAVCQHLADSEISVVLSGGAVVSIYSENEYESLDLDFIREGLATKVDSVMKALGFKQEKRRHWTHPNTSFWVEFPQGPLSIGEEHVRKVGLRTTAHGELRLLLPTECVMDRLAAFFHWGDRQALEQAVMVAARQPIDLHRVKKWASGEGPDARKRFPEFERRFQELGKNEI